MSTYARDPFGVLIGLGTSAGAWAPLTDGHGDVVAGFPVNGLGLSDQKVFDPFGVPTTAGSANVRLGFQGSWTDPATAKVSAQARWYTPSTGGFVSRTVLICRLPGRRVSTGIEPPRVRWRPAGLRGSCRAGSQEVPDELRERSVRLVLQIRREQPAEASRAISTVAKRLDVHPATLRLWVSQAEVDQGVRPGTTTPDAARIAELEREVRELKRANEILKAASAFFARELDPRLPR